MKESISEKPYIQIYLFNFCTIPCWQYYAPVTLDDEKKNLKETIIFLQHFSASERRTFSISSLDTEPESKITVPKIIFCLHILVKKQKYQLYDLLPEITTLKPKTMQFYYYF